VTAADVFTRACPLFTRAQKLAGRTGSAFEWTGSGHWFGLPRWFCKRSWNQDGADQ
jgi:hypothetical protein